MDVICNLLFDLGNVIIDIDIDGAKSRIEALLDPSYPGKEVEKELLFHIEKFEIGAISTDVFLEVMLKYARPGVSIAEVIEAWNSMIVGIPVYRLTMLERLRENYNVLLLSNTNALHLEWVHNYFKNDLGESQFDQKYFDDTYYSHLIRLRKPDTACFEHVIEESYITPQRTLFIDDFEINIKTAQKMGFQTHHSPANEEIAEVLKVKGLY
jgi:putative hydrolase of the HAD superfamily